MYNNQVVFEMKSELDLSYQRIAESMSTKILSEALSNFRTIKLPNAKDVSCIELYNNTLYVGTNQSKVFVFEVGQAQTSEHELLVSNQRSFYPHCTSVHFIVASPTFIVVVPLEEQQLIRIWNRQSLQILHGYKGHAKQITSVIFLRDSEHIASSSYDGTVRIWKISQKFEFDTEIRKHSSKYAQLTLIQLDSESVVFGGDECFITIWNWSKDIIRHKSFAHPGSVINLSFSQPNHLYSMGGDSKVCLWRVQQCQKTGSNTNEMLNEVVSSSEQKINLVLVRQSSATVSNKVFSMNISSQQLLAIDSKGNCFLMNTNLEVISSHLKLSYSQMIRSAKIWQNHLLIITQKKGKGELKDVAGQLHQMVNIPKDPQVFEVVTKIVKIEAPQNHQAFAQNDDSVKIMVQDIPEEH